MTVSCREIVVAVVFIGKTRETCREIVAVVVFKKQRQTEGNKERTDKEEKEKRTKNKQVLFMLHDLFWWVLRRIKKIYRSYSTEDTFGRVHWTKNNSCTKPMV